MCAFWILSDFSLLILYMWINFKLNYNQRPPKLMGIRPVSQKKMGADFPIPWLIQTAVLHLRLAICTLLQLDRSRPIGTVNMGLTMNIGTGSRGKWSFLPWVCNFLCPFGASLPQSPKRLRLDPTWKRPYTSRQETGLTCSHDTIHVFAGGQGILYTIWTSHIEEIRETCLVCLCSVILMFDV